MQAIVKTTCSILVIYPIYYLFFESNLKKIMLFLLTTLRHLYIFVFLRITKIYHLSCPLYITFLFTHFKMLSSKHIIYLSLAYYFTNVVFTGYHWAQTDAWENLMANVKDDGLLEVTHPRELKYITF